MPTMLTGFLTRRRPAAVAASLAAGCLLLVGCGGSSNGSSNNSSATPTGSALASKLVKLMAANQPQLKSVNVSCPSAPVTQYPINCRFTAKSGIAVKGKHLSLPSRGTVSVKNIQGGTIDYSVQFGSS